MKLKCTREQLLAVVRQHNVADYSSPTSINALIKLGGSWAIPGDGSYLAQLNCLKLREPFNEPTDAIAIQLWNWPQQIHHSTLIVFDSGECEAIATGGNGGRSRMKLDECNIFWNYIMKHARTGSVYKFPKEVDIG